MKKSRLVVLLLAFMLLAAGCGEEAATNEVKINETGYPIVSEPLTLTAVAKKHPIHGNWDELYWGQWAAEKSGITMEYEYVDNAAWEQKKQLMFASDELPDVIIGGGAFTTVDISKYGVTGKYLMPMNDLIDNYAPNIKAAMDKYERVRKNLTASDGNVYSLSKIAYTPGDGYRRIWVNTAWLDKLGLEMPTTTEEMREVLLAFRDQDPDGNGQNDTYPASGVYNNWEGDVRYAWLRAFGIWQVDAPYVKDGKVVFGPAEPEFKEYLKEMKYLFDEGLLDSTYYTQSPAEYKAKSSMGMVGVGAFSAPTASGGMTQEMAAQYEGFTPMTSSVLDEGIWDMIVDGTEPGMVNCGVGGFVITNKNKNPEATIRWADMWFTEEGGIAKEIGPKLGEWEEYPEVGYTLDENGNYTMQMLVDGQKPADSWDWTNKHLTPASDSSNFGLQPELLLKKPTKDFMMELGEFYKSYGQTAYDRGYRTLPPLYMEQADYDLLGIIKGEVTAYAEQMEAKFITGAEPIENFDAYVQTLKEYRLDEMLEIYQRLYDTYNQ